MQKLNFSVLLIAALLLTVGGKAFAVNELAAETTSSAAQQQQSVKGVVSDVNGPVSGATVVVVETGQGDVTGADGSYTVKAANGQHVRVSFMGYETQEVVYNGQTTLNFKLVEDATAVEEVVVTALGVTKQARAVGYATTKVATDEVVRTNAINPINALQGKVAGLNIQTTGASGVTSSSAITIRGAKSLDKSNSPIFVIDGMIITEPITGYLNGSDWGSQLKNLNPADYESITVLKGAAATALYGSRGANGAIVIVSKGGKFGKQGLGIELSQIVEMSNVYKSPIAYQNIYGAGSATNGYEGDFLADGSLTKTYNSFGPKMEGQMVDQYDKGGEKSAFVAHPDNWKALYQNAWNTTTNVAFNGGGEKTNFRASYSYTDNNGFIKYNEFERHAISFRTASQMSDVFFVEGGFNYAFSTTTNPSSQGGWDWGNNLSMITSYYMPRNFDMKSYYENYRDPETKAVKSSEVFGTISSLFHSIDMNKRQRSEQSLLANLTLRANIAPWLDASIKGNYNFYGIQNVTKNYGTGANYGPKGSGYYSRGGSENGAYNFLGMLHGQHNFLDGDLTFEARAVAEVYGNTSSSSWSKASDGGLIVPGVFAFSNSVNRITPSYSYTPANQRTIGVSGIINLGYKDQIFLEITGRNDWLSSLTYPNYAYIVAPANNYSVFYPSFNLSWVFTDTFDLPEWLSFGKFRASLGRVGMGTSAYATTDGYGVFSQSTAYDPDRNNVTVANPNLGTQQNLDLKPEIQQSIEIGADLRLFDERLNIDVAYYKTNTYNQILSLGGVAESGANSLRINAGNIQNQGLELLVEGVVIKNQDMRWSIGANYTRNRGKVKKLHNDIKEWQMMGQYDGGPEIWAYEGGAYGVFTTTTNGYGSYVQRYNNENDASDPNNGKMVLEYWGEYGSPNSVSAYGWALDTSERKIIGKVEADFTASFNTTFSYKNFDLYAQIDTRVGGNFYSNSRKYALPRGTLESTLEGRDKEHGGIARINYKGETVYNGIMLDGIFADGTIAPGKNGGSVDVSGMLYKDAVEQNLINPMLAGAYYWGNFGWGEPAEFSLQENTWVNLREITVGYRLSDNLCRKIGMNYLRLGLTARNICYLYSTLKDDLNPESISSNNPLVPIDIGGVPYSRTFSLSLTVKF